MRQFFAAAVLTACIVQFVSSHPMKHNIASANPKSNDLPVNQKVIAGENLELAVAAGSDKIETLHGGKRARHGAEVEATGALEDEIMHFSKEAREDVRSKESEDGVSKGSKAGLSEESEDYLSAESVDELSEESEHELSDESEDELSDEGEDYLSEESVDELSEESEDELSDESEDGLSEVSKDEHFDEGEDYLSEESVDELSEESEDELSDESEDGLSEVSKDELSDEGEDYLSEESDDGLSEESENEDGLSQESEDVLSEESEDALSEESEDALSEESDDALSEENESEDGFSKDKLSEESEGDLSNESEDYLAEDSLLAETEANRFADEIIMANDGDLAELENDLSLALQEEVEDSIRAGKEVAGILEDSANVAKETDHAENLRDHDSRADKTVGANTKYASAGVAAAARNNVTVIVRGCKEYNQPLNDFLKIFAKEYAQHFNRIKVRCGVCTTIKVRGSLRSDLQICTKGTLVSCMVCMPSALKGYIIK